MIGFNPPPKTMPPKRSNIYSSSARPRRPLNCPNCGAPCDYSQKKCAYCGTFYDEIDLVEYADAPAERKCPSTENVFVVASVVDLPKEGEDGAIYLVMDTKMTYIWNKPNKIWIVFD